MIDQMINTSNGSSVKRLVYTSYLSSDTSEADIFHMIKKAQKNNIDQEISGFLISDSEKLVQLIEGPESNVDKLFEKIKTDTRHDDVEIKFQDMADFRIMPFYGMGLCLVNSTVSYQQDFYFTRYQAREFSSLFEGPAGEFFRQYLE